MKKIIALFAAVTASPAMAATGPFFSLHNTNFVVLLAFLLFIAILLKFGVPGKITGLLDARAAQIKADLAEAKALREEAKLLLASYEQKQKEVQEQSDRIVAAAKQEAQAAATQAKADLKVSIERRITAAKDQIASAEAAALRQVREQAVNLAISVASEILGKQATPESAAASLDAAIAQVEAKLH